MRRQAAFAQGLEVVPDAGLLAEVAGLVEWPVVLMGAIGAEFLDLPPEVLQTSMKEHQKFFSVRNPKTGRIEKFVTVANRETADDGATILAGNQKVLSARLSDAKFFWENDLRVVKSVGMEGMAAGLANVTFHNKLGLSGRAHRPDRGAGARDRAAGGRLARPGGRGRAGGEGRPAIGDGGRVPGIAGRDGRLLRAGGGAARGGGGGLQRRITRRWGRRTTVPGEPVSVAVALADKIDTLTGFWAIDEKPTGSKDPFALRRAALGVIRLVLGNGVRLIASTAFDTQLLRSTRSGLRRLHLTKSDAGRSSERGRSEWLIVDGPAYLIDAEALDKLRGGDAMDWYARSRSTLTMQRSTSSPSSTTASRSTSATRASGTT